MAESQPKAECGFSVLDGLNSPFFRSLRGLPSGDASSRVVESGVEPPDSEGESGPLAGAIFYEAR